MPSSTPEISDELFGEAFRLEDRLERAKQILKLQGLDLWRGNLAEMRNDLPRAESRQSPSSSIAVGTDLHHAAAALRVREALDKLQPSCREMLYLRFAKDLSPADIAKKFEISTGEAEEQLLNCLRRAKELVKQQAMS